jgi:hypothetical protein
MNETLGGNLQCPTDTQQSRNRYRTASFDLLPMACRKTKRNHIFLRVALLLSQLAHPLPKCKEEFLLIQHYHRTLQKLLEFNQPRNPGGIWRDCFPHRMNAALPPRRPSAVIFYNSPASDRPHSAKRWGQYTTTVIWSSRTQLFSVALCTQKDPTGMWPIHCYRATL